MASCIVLLCVCRQLYSTGNDELHAFLCALSNILQHVGSNGSLECVAVVADLPSCGACSSMAMPVVHAADKPA